MKQVLFDGIFGCFFLKVDFEEKRERLIQVLGRQIEEKFKLPFEEQRITFQGKNLAQMGNDRILELISPHLCSDYVGPLHLNLYLLGGKGGFGSLLRGGPKGIKVNKVTNRDACRDLNGRRLRHAQAERSLQEWSQNARDTERDQRQGEKYSRQVEVRQIKEATCASFASESKELKEKIGESLSKALKANKKRKTNHKKGDDGEKEKREEEKGKRKEDKGGERKEEGEKKEEYKTEENQIQEKREVAGKEEKGGENESEQDLSAIKTAGEMEVFGLERLKHLLQSRGLKCGGTLKERAERLFEVKDLSKDQIPSHLKANSSSKKSRKRKK